MQRICAIALTMFVLLGAAYSQQPKAPDETQALGSFSTEDLIAKLQDESNQGIGTHETAWASGFMAINDEPKFNGGIIGSAKPVISPVMRELVRRGTTALPLLIDHLSDARPTKLIVGDGFMGKWFSDEYDPRDRDPTKLPPGVNASSLNTAGGKMSKRFDAYTVKVGDLCFVAIGQIINRQLNAVRYQPSLCLVVNSPVKTPALAAAVKADWGGLTPTDHQHSLEEDALNPSVYGKSPEAVKRLLFYYPDAGNAMAVRLLNRLFYDNTLIGDFLYKKLLRIHDAVEQDKAMTAFRKKDGDANYAGAELRLIGWANIPKPDPFPEHLKEQAIAEKMLDRLFPSVNRLDPPFIEATEFYTQHDLVDALATFHCEAIDHAVYDLLKRALESRPDNIEDVFARCELVHACALHLTKPDERDAFEKSYRGVMSTFPRPPESDTMTTFSKRFQVYLKSEIDKLESGKRGQAQGV